MSISDHENWIANFDCIRYQNFSLKTKFILGFFFIIIYLYLLHYVGLHNTHIIHILNYTRNIIQTMNTKH